MLWEGRFTKKVDSKVNDFNSSLPFDCRMFEEDITGSIAHVMMLGDTSIIPANEAIIIAEELKNLLNDIKNGKIVIENAEDIHSFVEQELTARLGDLGKKLHTARSRNDQVALDLRMYLKKEIDILMQLLKKIQFTLCDIAEQHVATIMPGYTHLQQAQPVTFAHHMMAYAQMFKRDYSRLEDCLVRMNECPLGCGALAGTTHPINRAQTAQQLGFNKPCDNSLDGVSDRDYCVELASSCSLIMVHLSRFAEEIILWCSSEFKFIEPDDAFSTGSSIMPQKKNPDVAELVRGKSGRVFGSLTTLLTMLKGIPLAYNKDMQEDKEAIFDCVDTTKNCLNTFIPMLATAKINKGNMERACVKGFINATDCADYLTKKGMPFREAYKIVGEIVAYCVEADLTLEELGLAKYKEFSIIFEADIFHAIALKTCLNERKSHGAATTVMQQIGLIKSKFDA